MAGNGNSPVFPPGGGGGGATPGFNGGSGASGYVRLDYTPAGTPAYNVLRFLLHVPASDVDGATVMFFETLGVIQQVFLTYNTASSGKLTMTGYDSGATLKFTSSSITGIDGHSWLISMELGPGATVAYALRAMQVDSGPVLTSKTGTASASGAVGALLDWNINTQPPLAVNMGIGGIVLQSAYEDPLLVYSAITGYTLETAGARFQRLCTEEGIASELTGNASDTPQMGAQPQDRLLDILQQTEDLDGGLIYETRSYLGLGYRTRTSLSNQNPAITGIIADYAQAHLSQPFQPVADDQLIRNSVTVTRSGGSSVTATQATGPLSTQDPPNGVGLYTFALTVNAGADSQLSAVATRILGQGTVDDFRYPQVTFDLTRAEDRELYAQLVTLPIGAYLEIANPPAFLTASAVSQVALGRSLDIAGFRFMVQLNCAPESPFEQ